MEIAAILFLKDYLSTQPPGYCQVVSDKMSFENVDKQRRMQNDGRLKTTQPAYSRTATQVSREHLTANTHAKIFFFKKACLNLLECFLYQGLVVLISFLH